MICGRSSETVLWRQVQCMHIKHIASAASLYPYTLMEIFLPIALLLVAATMCAALLRQLGCPGNALIGGVLAGVLLGPTLMGRVMPATQERLFTGGIEQREQLQTVRSRHGADLLAARAADANDDVLRELQLQHHQEHLLAEQIWHEAQHTHQQPQRILAAVLIVLILLGSSKYKQSRITTKPSGVPSITIGLWMATVPGAIVALVAWYLWDQTPAQSALLASAVMIGPWVLTRVDIRAAQRAEHGGAMLLTDAGRWASILAMAVALGGLWLHDSLYWGMVLFALPLAWIITAQATRLASMMHSFLQWIAIPTLAAGVTVKLELYHHFAFWPVLLMLIVSGDGRWLGAFVGTVLLGGRTYKQAMQLALGAMACGPMQLSLLALACHAAVLTPPMVFALLLGAVYVEATVPMRRWFARELDSQ